MSNRQYFEWLVKEIGVQNDYHNHKENMAWVITALYVPGILTLGFSLSIKSLECWAIVIIFSISWILTTAIVSKQLYLRSIAADTHLALTKLINEYCKNPETFSPCTTFVNGNQWPQFIKDEIDRCKGKGRTLRTALCTDVVLIIAILLSSIGAILLAIG